MGVIGLLALLANAGVALMLYRYRTGDANMRSVWICSRNDAIGNVAVLLAAAGVFGTGTGWPDVIVAAIMAALGISGGLQIVRQASRRVAPRARHRGVRPDHQNTEEFDHVRSRVRAGHRASGRGGWCTGVGRQRISPAMRRRRPMRQHPAQRSSSARSSWSIRDGRTVRGEDLHGKLQLVFFGFTTCPDICPTTLTKITAALEDLGADALPCARC